ncbi:MAG: cyclic nucleotide-binding domain-containing protein, partial [Spirochaetes bacterium]|nr:cyclic nucleotide-binding domain-containing protein [Spirochaetota bacterium]
ANSVIYFKGDASDRVFILNSGKVGLNSIDIETGQEVHDIVKTGEFFGMKSALGRYPREETAVVLQEAQVMAFTVPEFEALAMKNTRMITKMLKVFSNQLRHIHRQVQNLLVSDEAVNPETGLYQIGEYYLRAKKYAQALHAYKRYLTYYPSGQYARDVAAKLEQAEGYVSRYGAGGPPAAADEAPAAPAAKASSGRPTANAAAEPAGGGALSDVAKGYYNAVSLVSQEKYQEAYKEFKRLLDKGADVEYGVKAEFEMARCLYHLKQYDACIKGFTAIIQKSPKHPDLREAIFFIGRSYEEKGDQARAGSLYKKILSMGEDDAVARKARKALRTMEGGEA